MSAKAVVLGASIERARDHVRLLARTDKGALTLLFSDPLALEISRKLGVKAATPASAHRNHTEAAAAGEPLLKPSHTL